MVLLSKLETKKTNEEQEIKYIYKLTETEWNDEIAYGIVIEKLSIDNNQVIDISRECVELVSPIRDKVEKLQKMLYNYEVSPIHLIDVAGEYIDKCVLDFDKEYKDTRNII